MCAAPNSILRRPWPALIFLLAGCSPAYVFKSWRGHERLMSWRRPVSEMLSDPGVPADLKAKLRLVAEVRAFAFDTLGLPKTSSYTSYVALPRKEVTYALTACPKTALKPYEWWFPVIGRVPYKGFFDERDAEREKAALDRKGFDTHMAGVMAYSTLGWWADPVLSTMLDESPGELAASLLHEMTHAYVYFKGDADFNEAAASFVGEEGASDFLRRRFGEDSPELRQWRRKSEKAAEDDRRWEEVYEELKALYASPAPESEKLAKREAVFAEARRRLEASAINNAVVLAYRRYRGDLGDFRRAHERLGRSWPKTLELLRSLDKRLPRQALRRWIEAER
jgi:predicted aminopeptidase